MKPVAVTGAAGFIGRQVVERLLKQDADILALDCAPMPSSWTSAHCRLVQLSGDAVHFPEDWPPSSNGFRLVHLAWNLDRERHSFSAEARNVRLTAEFLERAISAGLQHCVALGSAAEYALCEGCLEENAVPHGAYSAYGWAKHSAYELAGTLSCQHSVSLLWLRPFVVYGPGQGGGMLIPYAVRCAAAGEDAFFSDGAQQRDFVYAADVVEAIVLALQTKHEGVDAVNIGMGQPVCIRLILEEIASHFPGRARFHMNKRDRRPGEPQCQYAQTEKAKQLLGWTAQTDWRAGIRLTCQAMGGGS